MPVEQVTEDIDKLTVLDEDGNVDEELEPDIDDETLLKMYKDMVYARKFDRKAFKLQRRGDMGTYAPFKGQEACQIGPAYAMADEDWFVPSFREAAFVLSRGFSPVKLFRYFMGDAMGNKVRGTNSMPVSIPIASQIPHAAGIGMAANIKGEDTATITYFGDGATSQGDFHGGLNFAGVYNAPVIFFNQNNQWAISTPREKQTSSETLAQKAEAYGIYGMQVDGNDVLACYKAVKDARDKAVSGEGPTMIEGITYRMGVHTTSDDPSRYRDEEEVEKWEKRDPLKRFEKYLMDKGVITEEDKKEFEEEAEKKLEEAVDEAMSMDDPETEEMFNHVYNEVPERLRKQLEEARERGGDN